ncbi:hypothetical protein KBY31_21435 [Ruegeria pomeroyi]|nr:hypothetical protein [Ruegeria pomeroyi]
MPVRNSRRGLGRTPAWPTHQSGAAAGHGHTRVPTKSAFIRARQTALIRQAGPDSGKVDGYRKLVDGLRERGKQVSEIRVIGLAGPAGPAAQIAKSMPEAQR